MRTSGNGEITLMAIPEPTTTGLAIALALGVFSSARYIGRSLGEGKASQ